VFGHPKVVSRRWAQDNSSVRKHCSQDCIENEFGFAQTILSTVIVPLSGAIVMVLLSSRSLSQDLNPRGHGCCSGLSAVNNAPLNVSLGLKGRQSDNFIGSWDKAKLDRLIARTRRSGVNNMKPYGGLASADVQAEVIAFLDCLRLINSRIDGRAAAQRAWARPGLIDTHLLVIF
jgi:hypothetical protein